MIFRLEYFLPASESKELTQEQLLAIKTQIEREQRQRTIRAVSSFNIILLLTLNLPIFGTVHYHFRDYQDEKLKLVIQHYRPGADCMDMQADPVLCWWQQLFSFGSHRIRFKFMLLQAIL